MGKVYVGLRDLKNVVVNAERREQNRLARNSLAHQISTRTTPNRYPEIFEAARDAALAIQEAPLRVLSFGCSTGDEVVSIRTLFPEAEITGIDVNRVCIRTCRRHNKDPLASFFRSLEEVAERTFHVIFCMAVLQRSPSKHMETLDISSVYPFEKFEKQVEALDRALVVGGILVIHHSFYSLCDCRIAKAYEPLSEYFYDRHVPKFDTQGNKISREYGPVMFRKVKSAP